jgi:hypothetical protein
MKAKAGPCRPEMLKSPLESRDVIVMSMASDTKTSFGRNPHLIYSSQLMQGSGIKAFRI